MRQWRSCALPPRRWRSTCRAIPRASHAPAEAYEKDGTSDRMKLEVRALEQCAFVRVSSRTSSIWWRVRCQKTGVMLDIRIHYTFANRCSRWPYAGKIREKEEQLLLHDAPAEFDENYCFTERILALGSNISLLRAGRGVSGMVTKPSLITATGDR
eukprot:1321552-Amorphochlora_amoeboformis.AAC.1